MIAALALSCSTSFHELQNSRRVVLKVRNSSEKQAGKQLSPGDNRHDPRYFPSKETKITHMIYSKPKTGEESINVSNPKHNFTGT